MSRQVSTFLRCNATINLAPGKRTVWKGIIMRKKDDSRASYSVKNSNFHRIWRDESLDFKKGDFEGFGSLISRIFLLVVKSRERRVCETNLSLSLSLHDSTISHVRKGEEYRRIFARVAKLD